MEASKLRTIVFSLVCMTMVCGAYANDPGTDPYKIMNLKFDESFGRCAFDSLRLCPGLVVGATSVTDAGQWSTGLYGNAVNFDRVKYRIDLAGSPCTRVLGNFQEKTISMWIAPRDLAATNQYIFTIVSSAAAVPPAGVANPFKFYVRLNGNTLEMVLVEGTVSSTPLIPSGTVDPLTWVHLAFVARNTEDGLSAIDMYINGVLAGTQSGVARHSSGFMYKATLGNFADYPIASYGFNGLVDEFRVYNKALSAQEVMAVKNDVPAVETWNPADNLRVYYKFDESSGVHPVDSSGSGLAGWIRGSSPQWGAGAYGNGVHFDGSAGICFANRATDESAFGPYASKTVSMWVNPDNSGSARYFFSLRPQGSTYTVTFYQYNNLIRMKVAKWNATFTGTASTGYNGVTSLAFGAWQHVAITTRLTGPTTCSYEIYLNGVMEYIIDNCLLDTSARWGSASFGSYAAEDGAGPAYGFVGSIDDLRVYGVDLSPVQLKAIYQYGPVLKGDIDLNKTVGMSDMRIFSGEWLADNVSVAGSEYLVENGDFESYADQAALNGKWQGFRNPASATQSSATLLTSPSDAHSGSQGMRWIYNAHDPNNYGNSAAVLYTFNNPVNLNQYDKMSIWLKRHPGNSTEDALRLQFYTDASIIAGTSQAVCMAAITWPNGSTNYPANIWDEWEVDLHHLYYYTTPGSLSNLTNVTGFTIGCDSVINLAYNDNPNSGGSGTIDFDDIKLIKLPICAADQLADFNGDCTVNVTDFATFAIDWLKQN